MFLTQDRFAPPPSSKAKNVPHGLKSSCADIKNSVRDTGKFLRKMSAKSKTPVHVIYLEGSKTLVCIYDNRRLWIVGLLVTPTAMPEDYR